MKSLLLALLAVSAIGDTLTTAVLCESQNDNYMECPIVGRIVSAALSKELSVGKCKEKKTWGALRDAIWVDKGCRARFVVMYTDG